MLKLYHGTTSVCAVKVRLVLAEKRLEWESELLNLQRGEQMRPEYLALNPNGVVPTLVHDGNAVIESAVLRLRPSTLGSLTYGFLYIGNSSRRALSCAIYRSLRTKRLRKSTRPSLIRNMLAWPSPSNGIFPSWSGYCASGPTR